MLKIGHFNYLQVIKEVDFGFYLDSEDDEWGEILLPYNSAPKDCAVHEFLEVFIYFDSEDRVIATTKKPLAVVGEFNLLRVSALEKVGAFMDWGLSKDLLVPFGEQKMRLKPERSYIVYVFRDEASGRIVGSTRLNKFIDQTPADYDEGQVVELLIVRETDLGYKAIINDAHWGFLYHNEIFKQLRVGKKLRGYVQKIREDGKIDLSLTKAGYDKVGGMAATILKALAKADGFLPLTSDVSPEEISKRFGVSKKNYKKALGALYKKRLVSIDPDGIRMLEAPPEPDVPATCLISCCIIAKNEAQRLPACLKSVAEIADETIVVDTGSDDGTAELAAELGATVLHQPWQDDFSAPRNLGLAHARGQWILVLDADERLSPRSIPALRVAIAKGDLDCGLLPLHDANSVAATSEDVVDGVAALGAPVLVPRLYRNVDDFKWEGIIHERPTSWLLRGPKRIRTVEGAAIVHYGNIPELRRDLGKYDRNLGMLEKQAALTPNDPRILDYLAYTLKGRGESERAAEVAAKAWRVLQDLADGAAGTLECVVTIATLHADFLREAGHLEACLEVLEQALGWCAGSHDHEHPNLLFQLGVGLEVKALRTEDQQERERCLAGARGHYEKCLQKKDVMYPSEVNPPECVGSLGWIRLGTVALMSGDSAGAREAMQQVLAADPKDVEAQLGMAEAAFKSGEPEECLRTVQGHLAMLPADALTLAALCQYATGQEQSARSLAAKAAQNLSTDGLLASHRRRDLVALCEKLNDALS